MARQRPLSPHLMIYRPQLTSMMSISHRLSGVALALGSVLLVWWLVALAHGGDDYRFFRELAQHMIGRLVLLGFFVAVAYHLANGFRHLLWDFGIGLSLKGVYRGGYLVLAATLCAAATGCAIIFFA